MSMRALERAILNEIIVITGRRKLRVKDIAEWSTSEDVIRKNATETETVIHCPGVGCWAAIPKE